MKKLCIIIIVALFTNYVNAQTITYSESFTGSVTYCPGDPQYDNWGIFRSQLDTLAYNFIKVTIKGSYDTVGRSCTDAVIVKQMAAALQNGISGTWTCGGYSWGVGIGCQGGGCGFMSDAIEFIADGTDCQCNSPAYSLRPCIASTSNWGGINTSSCSAPTQTMTVEFEYAPLTDIDAGITQITSPISGCGLAVYEDVTVNIKNFGLDTIFTFDVSYSVNGGVPITENISTTILPGNNFTHTFATQANLGSFGTYTFDAWTTLIGDTINFNDSITNHQVLRDSIFIFAEDICIDDAAGGAGSCNFSNDLCNDGYDYGDLTLKTSAPFVINTPTIDSITFYLYYSDCGFSTTDFSFYLNGTQIGTFTNTILECVCAPSLGTYPYIFSITDTAVLNAAWSDTNTLSVQHNNVDMAVAGYTATVYSQVQCPLLTAIEVANDTSICIGDSILLSVAIIDSNILVPPYSYSWSPSTGLSCDTCQSSLASPSSTISYTVLVTDSLGIQDSAIVTLTVFPAAPIADAGADTTICEDDVAQLNASGGASYLWEPGTGLSDSTIGDPLANPSTTTTWSLTAINACGSDIDSVTVFVNPLPVITISSDTGICPGDSVQLSASGGVSYSWNPTSGLDNPNIANPIASPSVTTTYIVAVTSDSGCTDFDSIIVVVDSVAQIIATAVDNTICLGDTTQLNVTSLFTCDDYDIDNITFATVSGSGTSVFLGDDQVSTALSIGFTFNFYCNDYTNFYISSNGFITFNNNPNSGCCSGQFLPNTSDPNNLIAFAWDDLYPPGNGTIDYFTTGAAPNRKLVMNFTDIPFCCGATPVVSTQTILYETTNVIEIHTTFINSINPGTMGIENDSGTVAHVVSGRNSSSWSATNEGIRFSPLSIVDTSLNYTWTPSTALSDPNIIDPLASPSTTTTYVVEAAIGTCSSFDTITIYVDTANFIVASPDTAICFGDSVQLTAIGSGAYLWSPSTGLSCTSCQSPYASPTTTTTYYVTTPAGCTPIDSVTVSVGGSPIIASATRDSICPGDTTQLFAYSCAPALFYDGFEDGTYSQWTDAGGGYTITPTTSTAAIGNYSLQLSGGNWVGFDGVYTTFNPGTPDYAGFYVRSSSTFNYDASIAIGDNNTDSTGGIMFFLADWSGFFNMNGITNPYNANQWYHIEYKNVDFINTTFDYYIDNVLIQSNVLFNNTASTYISQIHLFNYSPGSIAYYDDIIIGVPCSGIDTTLSYSWSPPAGLSNPNIPDPVANPAATTSYIVTAVGAGCAATDTVTIYTTSLNVSAISNTSTICFGGSAQLNATANIAGTSFTWSPAAGLSCTNCPDPVASPASTTTYTVTGTSGTCTNAASITINVNSGPVAASCTPITTSYCCGMGVYNVTFNTINNTTADGIDGYQDYTCTDATDVIISQTYSISIQTDTSLQENVRVWIDYNNDGAFDNDSTTELVFWSDNVLTNHSGTITIPFTAVVNTPLRMRVASDYYLQPAPAPCNNVTYGQVEDYSVVILPNTIPPVADFSINILDMCQGIVSFTDQSLYNPTSWFWDFGDGSGLSASQNPFYAYSLPGTYTVTLIVTNPYGSDTLSQLITINSLTGGFTMSNDTVNIGVVVNFFDNSTGANSWNWDFGDGFSSIIQNTFHAYSSVGTYTVTLTVTNASGCIAQIMKQIVVTDCSVGPQTGTITGPVNVNESATEFYSVTFHLGSTYNWTIIGGNQTSGGTTNFITVQWGPSGSGQIIVVEMDSLGCAGNTVSLIVNIGSTGINFQSSTSNFQLKVYPNPNNGKFLLKYSIPDKQSAEFIILDVMGRKLKTYQLENDIKKLNIVNKSLKNGLYFYQVIVNNRAILTDKFVIIK